MARSKEVDNVISFEQERIRRLQLLVDSGDSVAMYYLGNIYEDRGDIERALDLYIRSIEKSSIAMKELGILSRKYPKSYRKVIKEYLPSRKEDSLEDV